MKIGGSNDGDRIFTSKWKQFADMIHVDYGFICETGRSFVKKLIDEIDFQCERYIAQYLYFKELNTIVDTIKRRSAFLLEQWN